MKVWALSAAALLISLPAAHAGITFNATFDSSLTAPEVAAIQAAMDYISAHVSSPNNITDKLYFNTMTGGLGESTTGIYTPTYDDYYNALSAVATTPTQLAAIATLGAAASGNPVDGSTTVVITSAEGRNLGFNTPGAVTVGAVTDYDSLIALNVSLTSPPNGLAGFYGLESVAMHEIDESLGIGGTGSNLGNGSAVGDLDLFRYSAPGVRSFSTSAASSYFSIDGGNTVLSYFNQIPGADYADWASAPIPNGFGVQVQDAFGTPGTDPVLGANELLAFDVIGYSTATPEPATFGLLGASLLALGFAGARRGNKK